MVESGNGNIIPQELFKRSHCGVMIGIVCPTRCKVPQPIVLNPEIHWEALTLFEPLAYVVADKSLISVSCTFIAIRSLATGFQ